MGSWLTCNNLLTPNIRSEECFARYRRIFQQLRASSRCQPLPSTPPPPPSSSYWCTNHPLLHITTSNPSHIPHKIRIFIGGDHHYREHITRLLDSSQGFPIAMLCSHRIAESSSSNKTLLSCPIRPLASCPLECLQNVCQKNSDSCTRMDWAHSFVIREF